MLALLESRGHWFWTGSYAISSLGSQASELRLELYQWLSWQFSFQLQFLGLLSLHNHMSQFFITNFFLYIYVHPGGSVSLENSV